MPTSTSLRITLAQLDFVVGDIEGNAEKIIIATQKARDSNSDLIVFPELALTGYPAEDLLFRHDLYQRIDSVLPRICAQATDIDIIVGYPAQTPMGCYNRASFIHQGKIILSYDKQELPNYGVFDEVRYFVRGSKNSAIVDVKGIKIALLICEDLWIPGPIAFAKATGAQCVISLNASPFTRSKAEKRQQILTQRISETHLPIVYVNCVGGQDELVFDGGSMVIDQHGTVCQQADFFTETLLHCELDVINGITVAANLPKPQVESARIYHALVLGLRDYIEKNQFPHVVLGLSGGIDSALTLALAVDAVGNKRVTAIMMPSRYTSDASLELAKQQADTLKVDYKVLSIEALFNEFLTTLDPLFHGLPLDTTEENIQARCRGTLLMAFSNKKNALVLATGNKSEMAVGYCTLYGDLVGGFCVLKDILKTQVYQLARYRNQLSPVIPDAVITRAPSAELAPNQIDQDTLPPYEILDAILAGYIEEDKSLAELQQAGFDMATVRHVTMLVDRNEYKRRQAAIGICITERAFGKDRRYPITSAFKPFTQVN